MTTEATRQAQAKNLQLERHTEKLTLDVEELRRAGPSSGVTAEQLNDIYGKIFAQAEEISALTEALKAPQEKIAGLHQTIYDKDGEIRKMTEKKEESTITLGVLRSSLLELQIQLVKDEAKIRDLTLEGRGLEEKMLMRAKEKALEMDNANKQFLNLSGSNVSNSSVIANSQISEEKSSSFGASITPSRKPSFVGPAGTLECCGLSFSPTGTSFVTGGGDKTVRIWDSALAKVKTNLTGPERAINTVAFSNNDEYLLATSNDHSTRIWSLQTSRVVHSLTGHLGKVIGAVFSPDSMTVITGSHDRSIKIWDLTRGFCKRNIVCDNSANDILISRDGNTIISGHLDCSLRTWDVRTGEGVSNVSKFHTAKITGLCLSKDGNSVLTVSKDNTLKLIDVRKEEALQTFKHDDFQCGSDWTRCCLSPDTRYAVAGSNEGAVYVWNTADGTLEKKLQKGHKVNVPCVAWNPNGQQLVSADKAGVVAIWPGSTTPTGGDSQK